MAKEYFKKIRTYLERKKMAQQFFEPGGHFNLEQVKELKDVYKIYPAEFRKCFKNAERNEFYSFEVKCLRCEQIYTVHSSKGAFLEYLNKRQHVCGGCRRRAQNLPERKDG